MNYKKRAAEERAKADELTREAARHTRWAEVFEEAAKKEPDERKQELADLAGEGQL